VPSEFPLFSRDLMSNGVIPALNSWSSDSSLGRGFLTGMITSIDDLKPADARCGLPRFQLEAIASKLTIVERSCPSPRNYAPAPLRSRSPGSEHTALPHIHIVDPGFVGGRPMESQRFGPRPFGGFRRRFGWGRITSGKGVRSRAARVNRSRSGRRRRRGVHVPSRPSYACESMRARVPRKLMRPMSGADARRGAR
jgi:hypothetical protein